MAPLKFNVVNQNRGNIEQIATITLLYWIWFR